MDHQKRDFLSFSIDKLLSCDGCTKTTKLKHRRRSSFSAVQVHWLENEFRCHRYISPERRAGLAALLGLTQQQIKIWFQNRRYKTKFRQNNGKTTNLETKLNPQNLMASVTGQELMKYFIRPQIWNNYYCNLAKKLDLKSEEPKVADTTEDQNKSNEIFDLM